MGFFKKLFKGIKKVVKGIGKVIKKVVKSKPFKAIAAVATAVFAPQLLPMVAKGLSTAAAWTASTIAKGATVAWNAAKAIGTGIKTFGSKVFSSITDTISNGVDFMKGKLGMKPTTLQEGMMAQEKIIAESLGRELGTEKAKMTFGDKIAKFIPEPIKEGLKEEALTFAEQTITDAEKGGDDPTGQGAVQQFRYADEDIRVDTGAGYEQLASLGMDIQSPYLGYQQGQQLFGIRTA
tara:strand:- start:1045 stop:1752 length:708 start_codon:yes stop_codon:yes gene_type:complete